MNSHPFPIPSGRDHRLTESVRSLLLAALHYAEARVRLFWLECHEVVHRGLALVALSLLAILSVIITYFGGMIALALWIARTWWNGDMLPAIVILSLGHLLLATCCAAWIAHAAKRAQFFHASLKEFKEDRQWLQTNQTSRN
jgi:uncharacterized membrane protein YqjE